MTQTPAPPSSFQTLVTIATLATLGGASLGFLLRSQPDILPRAGLLQREQNFPDRSWPGESITDLETSLEPLWFDSPQSTEEGYGIAPEEYSTEGYGYEEIYPDSYSGSEAAVEPESTGEESGNGFEVDQEFQDESEGYIEPEADLGQDDPNAAPVEGWEGDSEVVPDLEAVPDPGQDLPAIAEPAPIPAPPEPAPPASGLESSDSSSEQGGMTPQAAAAVARTMS